MTLELIHGDSSKLMEGLYHKLVTDQKKDVCVVTDPPFNVGYHYKTYKDNIPEDEYYHWLSGILTKAPKIVIHYPEALHRLSIEMGVAPIRVVSWVYNSNTARQHRDIAFYGIKPNFRQVKQPYKNPNDKRIKERISKGEGGGTLYDWWNVNQIKNVSKTNEGIDHPCVMPVEVMTNIIGVLPKNTVIIDPFLGSGTTGVACAILGYDFYGIEKDEDYFNIAKSRIEKENRLKMDAEKNTKLTEWIF